MNAPAKAVDLAVSAVRLPITLAEQVVGEDTVTLLPPVRVATAVQAWMLDAGGSLLNDERLTARASLLRAAVDRRAQAGRLELVAEEHRQHAAIETEESLDEAKALREEAAKAAAAERRRTAQAKQAAKRATKGSVAQAATIVDKVDQKRQQRVAADDRAARRASLVDERRALAEERKAVAAQRRALKVKDELKATKASRRAKNS